MESRYVSQKWILDAMLRQSGIDILHPESGPFFAECGFHPVDLAAVMSRIKGGDWQVKAYASRGAELEHRARRARTEGLLLTGRDLFLRAAVLYGRAQYHINADTAQKRAYHAKLVECFEAFAALHPTPIERVAVPLAGKAVYGVLHLPARRDERVPVVVLFPGGDMIKEYWSQPSLRYFLERGLATFAVDGPGAGETRVMGLTGSDATEVQAIHAVVDYLQSRPEIDPDRIGVSGVSGGSRASFLCAAAEPRIKAAAVAMGYLATHRDGHTVVDWGAPHFIRMAMYRMGIADEAEFLAVFNGVRSRSDVAERAAEAIRCPFFLAHGEFDETTSTEENLRIWDLIGAPKELWLFEDQFHPLGPVYSEVQAVIADWLAARLGGVPLRSNDIRRYVRRDGSVVDGDATPPWWSPDRLLAEVAARDVVRTLV